LLLPLLLLLGAATACGQTGGAVYADSTDFTLDTTGVSTIIGGASSADSANFTLNMTGVSSIIGGAAYADSGNFTLNTTGVSPIAGGATSADSADFTLNTTGVSPIVGGATSADSASFTLNTTGVSPIIGGAAYADSGNFTLNTTGVSPIAGGATSADSADFTLNTTGVSPIIGGATSADSADFTLNTTGVSPIIGGATSADSADFTLNTTGLPAVIGGAGYADSGIFTLLTDASVTLAATNRYEAPVAGGDSVILAVNPGPTTWSATPQATWLHVTAGSQNGNASATVFFTFDANTGVTRTGTITIGGQTLNVTQAGSTYVAADLFTNLVSTDLVNPQGLAVDGAGNVYIADAGDNSIKEYTESNNTLTPLITAGLNEPEAVAVDAAGNLYIDDNDQAGITKWTATNNTLTLLVGGGLVTGVAVDGAGNVYFNNIDDFNAYIYELPAGSAPLSPAIPLTSVSTASFLGLTADLAGNVYNVSSPSGSDVVVQELPVGGSLITLEGFNPVFGTPGVAADAAGNLFLTSANFTNGLVLEFPAGSAPLAPLSTVATTESAAAPSGIAVDGMGSIYVIDTNTIKELPHAFVDTTPKMESKAAGSDSLPVVVPATANLSGSFAPFSSASWLTINNVVNGVVNFSFTANNSDASRTAHINLLGQTINVTQLNATYALGTTTRLEGPAMGGDSVILTVTPNTATWTAAAGASWLHLSTGYQAGTGGTNVIFSFDANAGATRTGTLTVAGQTVNVTQAGSNFIAAAMSIVVPNVYASGLAVDNAGNLYVAVNAIYADTSGINGYQFEWTNPASLDYEMLEFSPAGGAVTTVVPPAPITSSLSVQFPGPMAVDSAGNLYFVGVNGAPPTNAVYKWTKSSGVFSTFISHAALNLQSPSGLAFDSADDLYISDETNGAIGVIYERTAAGAVTTFLNTGVNNEPGGVAVDAANNVYTTYNGNIVERLASSGTLINPEPIAGLAAGCVAVDGGGNLFSTENQFNLVEWTAANNQIAYKGYSELNVTVGPVAVDGADNVYISDPVDECVKELPRAFVDPTPKFESLLAGNDVLSAVAPATANLTGPLAPTTDQPWLSINSVINGVVSFAFSANNTGAGRTGHIIVLGQPVSVTQAAPPTLGVTARWEGPAAGQDSVILVANPYSGPWVAAANNSWLHISPATTQGVSSTNVIFSFDANPSAATRVGSITIGGVALNVTQAGSNYVAVSEVINLVSTGLSFPAGVTVDGSGNVYIADTDDGAVKEWVAASQSVTTLVPSGTLADFSPVGVAVDGAGDLYIAEKGYFGDGEPSVYKYTAATQALAPLPATVNSGEQAVALDSAGNLYLASTRSAIYEYTATNDPVTDLVFSGLVVTGPGGTATAYDAAGFDDSGVAVDAAGNVYMTAGSSPGAFEWSGANNPLAPIPINPGGNFDAAGVAVDGAGNSYFIGDFSIEQFSPASSAVTTIYTSANTLGDGAIAGIALDSWNNLYFTATQEGQIRELRQGFVNPTHQFERAPAGSDSLPPVLPAPESLTGPFTPASDSIWLTINGVVNGVVNFSFTANTTGTSRTGHITVLGQAIAITQNSAFMLAATNRYEAPAAGGDSVILAVNPGPAAWNATANNTWLHVTAGSQSGNASATVFFTFDANTGVTRTGTITIGDQTLSVTQAGSTYVAANLFTNLVSVGLVSPQGLAVDDAGNVYIADEGDNSIKEYTEANNTLTPVITSGLNMPAAVAVDTVGNLYINNAAAITKWTAANNTLTTLVDGFFVTGVAVDGVGNVYLNNGSAGDIDEFPAGSPPLSPVTVLASASTGSPSGLTADLTGNVYNLSNAGEDGMQELPFGGSLFSLEGPDSFTGSSGLAADAAGNVFLTSDRSGNPVTEYLAGSAPFAPLSTVSAIKSPADLAAIAVDDIGSIYVAVYNTNTIMELPHAFVDTTPKVEGIAAGSDSLPVVVPATANLNGSFAPVSNASWLTINNVLNGVVNFSFTANYSGASRTAQINLLGQTINVTQGSATYALGTTTRLEGPAAGGDSVILTVTPNNSPWAAAPNASWLHLSAGNQNGAGGATLVFTFDANTGATRAGTLTIAGQTVNVTQAGAGYVPAGATTLSSSLSSALGLAVDGANNVYVANTYANAIDKWTAASQTLSPLVSLGTYPAGVAVDGSGNLYIVNLGFSAELQKWTKSSGLLTTPVTGLDNPTASGVAVDSANNVYITDAGYNLIEKYSAAGSLSTLVSGLDNPEGLAVDVAGNVYEADYYSGKVKEWQAASSSLIIPVPSGVSGLQDVAVDGGGNLFVAGSGGLDKWTLANNSVASVGAFGALYAVAVDGEGNVYVSGSSQLQEVPNAWLVTTPKMESPTAGSDSLPAVVPATASLTGVFAPVSSQSWLTINGTADGVVSFSFPANPGLARTASITLLGQTISITQASPSTYALNTATAIEAPAAGGDSVILSVTPNIGTWTATTTASWLHFSGPNQGGTGSATVAFTFDANTGATRTGTATIGGQTLTVTQAGATYTPAEMVGTLVSGPGLVAPYGVAVDGSGNVYIADTGSKTIKEWLAASDTVITLVSTGLSDPVGVAVDAAGDVYIADGTGNKVYELPSGGTLLPLVTSGLNDPTGLAVDSAGNLFIANTGDKAIDELPAGGTLETLVSTGLSDPTGVAVDVLDDVYIADGTGNKIYELPAGGALTAVVSTGLDDPTGVAVNSSGTLYIADTGDNAIYYLPAGGTLTFLSFDPNGVALDASGNVYFSDGGLDTVDELQYAFVDTTPKFESAAAGSDVLPAVVPATANLSGSFAPASDQPWLSISSVANGVVGFTFQANNGASRTAHITLLGEAIEVIQSGASYTLGTTSSLEGPAAGIDSVVLATIPVIATWTAAANASWLHLNQANQSGTGPTNVIFSYDANPGATRTGTLNISGQTLTVTQAGATYVATGVNGLANLVPWTDSPNGVTVDGAGNLYFADPLSREIKEWTVAGQSVITLVPSSAGLSNPYALAVDSAGNVFIADIGNNTIEEWPTNGNSLITLVSSAGGLYSPESVAVDGAGNVYIADTGNAAIKKWTAANGNVATLVSGLNAPTGVAVDVAGNVYIADLDAPAVYEWIAASDQTVTLASSPQVDQPRSVAVDGAGNVYIADSGNNTIEEWSAASNTVTILVPGLNLPLSVAVDGPGNIYFVAVGYNGIQELPHAFVDPTPRLESMAGGSDALPAVLPATANLAGPFAPGSDQSWLSITGIANDVVGFDFAANTTASALTAHITLLGQTITIVQNGPYSLSTYTRVEGPGGGNDSVILLVGQGFPAWTSSASDSWLHISQNGTGSASVVFSYDYNPGATRTGSLTIAGETLTVTQAASTYVQSELTINLVSSGLNQPNGVAVDGAGNVYIADTGNNAIEEWMVASDSVTTLVSSAQGLSSPSGVAVDGAGNVYIADTGNNAIEEWPAGGNSLINVVASTWGLYNPKGVAVDTSGNVYIADTGNDEIAEWTAANNNVATLVSSASGLYGPEGVAVDVAGNVYIADTDNYAFEEWTPAGGLTTLAVNYPQLFPAGVAVDIAGNAYIADSYNDTIEEWTPAQGLDTLPIFNLDQPSGVAVDVAGNVYIADIGNDSIDELPYAFVDPTPKFESASAGSDALPIVLPATANLTGPFTPASDQPWLTLAAQGNGVVAFSFTANTGPDRTANITLFDQSIPVTQAGIVTMPLTITGIQMPEQGVIQFTFTNAPGASFTVLSTTNLSVPLSNWTVVGAPVSISPGVFQFTSQPATGDAQRYYAVRSP
jgi:sugar lactone lactonase YvrE